MLAEFLTWLCSVRVTRDMQTLSGGGLHAIDRSCHSMKYPIMIFWHDWWAVVWR